MLKDRLEFQDQQLVSECDTRSVFEVLLSACFEVLSSLNELVDLKTNLCCFLNELMSTKLLVTTKFVKPLSDQAL